MFISRIDLLQGLDVRVRETSPRVALKVLHTVVYRPTVCRYQALDRK